MTKITLKPDEPDTRVINAADRANRALVEAEQASARGDQQQAELLRTRHQFWLAAYNRLTGRT